MQYVIAGIFGLAAVVIVWLWYEARKAFWN